MTDSTTDTRLTGAKLLEKEGDVAADYLEGLLDIADLDGDIDIDVEGNRAMVSVLESNAGELGHLVDEELAQLALALQFVQPQPRVDQALEWLARVGGGDKMGFPLLARQLAAARVREPRQDDLARGLGLVEDVAAQAFVAEALEAFGRVRMMVARINVQLQEKRIHVEPTEAALEEGQPRRQPGRQFDEVALPPQQPARLMRCGR